MATHPRWIGIVGVLVQDTEGHVNQALFDALTVLQHRGQDAAGMVTASTTPGSRLNLKKSNGLVKEVFQQRDMEELQGNIGLGHVRYPTAGSSSCAEAQPLYTNCPHGLCIAHNGTLTNTAELRDILIAEHRHLNTSSDSEVLLNIFAKELEASIRKAPPATGQNHHQVARENIFDAVQKVIQSCTGGYAVIMLIAGVGLLGFRDPNGIRPLVFGKSQTGTGTNYVFSSESVAIDSLGYELERDVQPAEAILIQTNGHVHTQVCHPSPKLNPCVFEYVYFARPDSVMDGVPVYESRLRMGEKLALKIMREHPDHGIDVVVPIPDTSRASALQCAYTLGCPFREGFIKNRYIARTFIMPGQASRRKNVRLKLNTIKNEFKGKNVLLVDDSIVRGTTSKEIVAMARDAGPNKIFFCSAAPEIKFPNVYGIDIPTRTELIAHNRTTEEIARHIGVDWLVYQDLEDLEESIRSVNPEMDGFDSSCFSGSYVTPDIDEAYLTSLEASKQKQRPKLSGKMGAANGVANGTAAAGGGPPAAAAAAEDAGECEALHNPKRAKIEDPAHLA